ncbi:hypothetical protein HaLaN_28517, partial [Haematococcus lacustris]
MTANDPNMTDLRRFLTVTDIALRMQLTPLLSLKSALTKIGKKDVFALLCRALPCWASHRWVKLHQLHRQLTNERGSADQQFGLVWRKPTAPFFVAGEPEKHCRQRFEQPAIYHHGARRWFSSHRGILPLRAALLLPLEARQKWEGVARS